MLRGRLDPREFRLEQAEVVAISEGGQTHRAPMSASGAFEVRLRTGRAYEIRFAKATRAPGVVDEFAYLVHATKSGIRTRAVQLTEGPPVDLGRVTRRSIGLSRRGLASADDGEDAGSGDETASNASDATQEGGAEETNEEADDSDDGEAQESDDEDTEASSDDEDSESESDSADMPTRVCELSGGMDTVAVQAENNLLDAVDSDGDGAADADDTDLEAACQDLDVDSDSDGGAGAGALPPSDADDDADSDADSDSDSDGAECTPPGQEIPDTCDSPPGGVPPNPGAPNDPNAPTGDADGDGVPNSNDPSDSDGDGVPDMSDPSPGGDPANPAAPAGDADGDGIPNANDPTPNGDNPGAPDPGGPSGGACSTSADCAPGMICSEARACTRL